MDQQMVTPCTHVTFPQHKFACRVVVLPTPNFKLTANEWSLKECKSRNVFSNGMVIV